jgi:NAD(P)-dependent dehydrogenase (short-subunit alcohol dehydrogenase family)
MSYEKLHNLNGQVAVVTGAAGGVGRAVLSQLAKSGAKLVAIVRKEPEALQGFLNTLGTGHLVYVADVRNSGQLAEIASKLTQCDIVVNCAGASRIIPHKQLNALSDEAFDEILSVNLRSVFSVVRAFNSLLQASSNGLVVNIGSAAAVSTGGSNIAYAAAKAGLDSMTRNLAIALAPVRVVTISPSALDTGFTQQPPEFFAKVAANTPLKRCGTPEDVASAVEAVATSMRFMTGNTILVDGGRTL